MKRNAFVIILLSVISLISACDTELSADEYVKNGLAHLEKRDWKSAIIEFKNAVKQSPEDARARALLGQTYIETDSANAAIKELTRAIDLGYDKSSLALPLAIAYQQVGDSNKIIDEIDPDDGQNNTDKAILSALRGAAYQRLGDKVAAQAALEKAKNLDGEATEVRLAWAAFENANGDVEAQERWLQPLLERDGGVADAWSQMAQIEQRRGNLADADQAISRAIEIRPVPHFDYVRRALIRIGLDNIDGAQADIAFLKSAGANWPLLVYAEGLADYRLEKYADAQARFLETQLQLPAYPPAKLMTGMAYFYQQKYADAAIYLKQYLDAGANNLDVSMIYATSLLATQDSARALEVLEELNAREPDNFRILSLLSNAYLRAGKTEPGLEVLQRAVKIAPQEAGVRLQLGATLMDNSGTVAAGQQELKKALELDPSLEKARLVLFMSHLRQKEFSQALKIAREIDQQDESKSIGANLIGLTYLGEGKVEQAKQQFRQTLERFPADITTSHNLGRVYLNENALDEARALYTNMIENNPNHMRSLEQLALISAREGNRGDMMQWLQKAVDRNPNQSRPRLVLASQHLQQGNPADAARVLNDVDVEDKENTEFIILMARVKVELREYDQARRLLENLIRRQPDLGIAYFQLARVYAAQSEIPKARQALEQTVKIAPDNLSAQIILARFELIEGNEASFDARLAILEEKFPGNTQVELLKARKSSAGEDYESAIKQLSGLLAETDQAEVVMELARNQWQSGDRQGAISSLELWSESKKDNKVLLLLAELYLLEKRDDDAVVTYTTLEQMSPSNPAVLNNLAWSLKDSNPDKGLEYARKASALQPSNPLIMDTLAVLLLNSGNASEALETIRVAAEKAPGVVDIQLNLSEILAANGKKEEAREILTNLLNNTQREETKQIVREKLDSL